MNTLKTTASMLEAATHHPDPDLRRLLVNRIASLQDYDCDLAELVQVLLVEPGDTLAALEAELGVELTTSWETIERQGGWYELTFILSDWGEGIVVFVPDQPGVPQELLTLCREHAT